MALINHEKKLPVYKHQVYLSLLQNRFTAFIWDFENFKEKCN